MDFDLKRFTYTRPEADRKNKPLPKHRHEGGFLKGPIPWNWLSRAGQLPGHALHVAIVLWLIRGIEKNAIVKLSAERAKELGVGRSAMYRGLAALESVGLVCIVEKHRGRSPIVEIMGVPEGGETEDRWGSRR